MENVIKKLELKEKDKSTLRSHVVKKLLEHCEKEENFKEKILNEKKSLNECINYIIYLAKEEAKGENSTAIEDSTVYGWAIHYFDEEELEDFKKETTSARVETKEKEAKKEVKKDDKSRTNKGQLSLFDF